jgi:hypothetical protein
MTIKKCGSCERPYNKVPEKHRKDQFGGCYWECEDCNSTLTYFDDEAKRKVIEYKQNKKP